MKCFNMILTMLQLFNFFRHIVLQILPFHRQPEFGEHPSLTIMPRVSSENNNLLEC